MNLQEAQQSRYANSQVASLKERLKIQATSIKNLRFELSQRNKLIEAMTQEIAVLKSKLNSKITSQ